MVKKRQPRHASDFKFKVVMDLLTSGKTGDQVSVEYRVPRQTVYRWREQLLSQGPRIFDGEADERAQAAEVRIAELERLVGRLTMEVEVLKKTSSLVSSRPLKDEA